MQEYFNYLVVGSGAGLAVGLVMVVIHLSFSEVMRFIRTILSV